MTPQASPGKPDYDVIVIGGGPAGSTVATLVAAAGRSVVLLEREPVPRFKIGESLMPGTYWTFKRLGMLDKLKQQAFPKKYSVQFFSQSGKGSRPFYFNESDPHESAVTWQVLRSEFDKMLLDNAREKGVEVRQGVAVQDVLFEDGRAVGVRIARSNGTPNQVSGTIIVDATGQSTLIARKLGLKTTEEAFKKASIFTHYEGGVRDSGIDEGATLIFHTARRDSWFWYIPLQDNRVSVGVVGDMEYLLQSRKGTPQAIFEEELELCRALQPRLSDARQLFPVKVTKDFSYRSRQLAGENWVLVGDAYGFLDPIYSAGVFLALKSGEMAADAIIDAFDDGDFSGDRLGRFAPELSSGMEAIRKLVYAFYAKDFSFARFLKKFPDCQQGLVDILSGKVFQENVHDIFTPMREMCSLPEDMKL